MKTTKTQHEVFQFLKKQDWAREFERIILNNLGMTLAAYIVCCDNDYGKFFSEANVPMTDTDWKNRSATFINFLSK